MIISFRLIISVFRHYLHILNGKMQQNYNLRADLFSYHEIHDFSLIIQFIAIYLHYIVDIQFKFK